MVLGSILWQILDFRAKHWIKDTIKCCHWARTTNIGLLYPNVRNNIGGDIFIDVPNQTTAGDVSPASPAGLTPVVGPTLYTELANSGADDYTEYYWPHTCSSVRLMDDRISRYLDTVPTALGNRTIAPPPPDIRTSSICWYGLYVCAVITGIVWRISCHFRDCKK